MSLSYLCQFNFELLILIIVLIEHIFLNDIPNHHHHHHHHHHHTPSETQKLFFESFLS